MEERLTLTIKGLKRLRVLGWFEAERMTVADAAQMLGISQRQCWRVLARYRQAGAAGLAHGNRGRTDHEIGRALSPGPFVHCQPIGQQRWPGDETEVPAQL